MTNLRLDNTIFLMFIASEEYKREHNLSSKEFLDLDKKYKILNYIATCPDVFDSMNEKEMAKEIDYYVSSDYRNALSWNNLYLEPDYYLFNACDRELSGDVYGMYAYIQEN